MACRLTMRNKRRIPIVVTLNSVYDDNNATRHDSEVASSNSSRVLRNIECDRVRRICRTCIIQCNRSAAQRHLYWPIPVK